MKACESAFFRFFGTTGGIAYSSDWLLFSSFNAAAVRNLRAVAPWASIGILWDRRPATAALTLAEELGACCVIPGRRILDRDVGIYTRDAQGRPDYNFTYIDQIYDGLLQQGVRPFVELGFMPPDMAARQQSMGFWYDPIVAPPRLLASLSARFWMAST